MCLGLLYRQRKTMFREIIFLPNNLLGFKASVQVIAHGFYVQSNYQG